MSPAAKFNALRASVSILSRNLQAKLCEEETLRCPFDLDSSVSHCSSFVASMLTVAGIKRGTPGD